MDDHATTVQQLADASLRPVRLLLAGVTQALAAPGRSGARTQVKRARNKDDEEAEAAEAAEEEATEEAAVDSAKAARWSKGIGPKGTCMPSRRARGARLARRPPAALSRDRPRLAAS